MFTKLIGIGASESVGDVLDRHRGIGPSFDLLRFVLAFYIFYGHSFWLAGTGIPGHIVAGVVNANIDGNHGAVFTGWTRPFHVAVVPIFFALSGFLVTGSAMRLRATSTFLAFRALRIFPALIVEVSLCALILGPLLSEFDTATYFQDPSFARYLANCVGWITFHLPGLFLHNPVPVIVNANLWTLPAEFDCYFITALLMFSGVIYNRNILTALFTVVTIVFFALNSISSFAVTPGILPPFAITYYFFAGMLFFFWRHKIPARRWMFIAATIAGYVLLMFQRTVFVVPFLLIYCTIFFGLIRIPKIPLLSTGDYSYGIYLYGFPITQALIAAFPTTFAGHRYLLLTCSTVCTCAFAAFSWHMIEKRVLPMKRLLPLRLFPVRRQKF